MLFEFSLNIFVTGSAQRKGFRQESDRKVRIRKLTGMQNDRKISVFDYTDYRKYLLDYYLDQKAKDPAFSFRFFAKKAGYNSSGMYKDIVNGRTNITPEFVAKLSVGCGHREAEKEYFAAMVLFNQAEKTDEKKGYFTRMMCFYNSKAHRVDAAQHEFYSKWYFSAIRDLLACGDFGNDYGRIAATLQPKIKPHQAKKALKVLSKLGLIQRNEEGFYKAVDKLITTGDEVHSLNVKSFQSGMMDLAKSALEDIPKKHRNISTLTFSISKEVYNEIESEVIAFRKKILGIVEKGEHMDRVYQLNLQLFPLTKIGEKSDE